MAPTKTARGWKLPTENREDFWFLATQSIYKPIAKRFIVYSLGPPNRIVGLSIRALQNGTPSIHAGKHPKLRWRTARLQAKTLATAPLIPNPTPVCP